MSDLSQILEYAGKLTVSGILLLVLWALFTGRLRLAREVHALEKRLDKAELESDRWENIALRGMNIAATATNMAATATSPPPSPPGN